MKIAHIYPVNNMQPMFHQEYNMLLTHLALDNPIYKNKARKLSEHSYTILDNSLIELEGKALGLKDVCDVADYIRADEIILPDVFQDGYATVTKATESLGYLEQRYPQGIPFKVQAVAHGKTVHELETCFDTLKLMKGIDVIGVPKILSKLSPKGRPAFEYLWQHTDKEIHLLGMYYSFEELLKYKNPKKIRSVDTCQMSFLIHNELNLFDVRPDGHTIDLESTKLSHTRLRGMRLLECLIN